jgi:hypothetical protein
MFRNLWARLTGRRDPAEAAQEWEHMSPEERRFVGESVDDRAAEIESEAHLGGFGANDLQPGDRDEFR